MMDNTGAAIKANVEPPNPQGLARSILATVIHFCGANEMGAPILRCLPLEQAERFAGSTQLSTLVKALQCVVKGEEVSDIAQRDALRKTKEIFEGLGEDLPDEDIKTMKSSNQEILQAFERLNTSLGIPSESIYDPQIVRTFRDVPANLDTSALEAGAVGDWSEAERIRNRSDFPKMPPS